MDWIDEIMANIKDYNGSCLTEKLAVEMWDTDIVHRTKFPEFIKNACLIIDFDTELAMEGILTLLENSIGQYMPEIIKAFRSIGDNNDADILSEIFRLAPPDKIRTEFIENNYQEYDITSFSENHEIDDETIDKIVKLESRLYMNTDFDMWSLLYNYLDKEIEKL